MSNQLNTLNQRIYRNGVAVGPGEEFEGKAEDVEGIVPADSAEADAYREARDAGLRSAEGDADVQKALAAAAQASAALSTANLRDRIDESGHREHGTGLDRLANSPSMPANDPHADENLPAPEVGEPAALSTGVPGDDAIAGPRDGSPAAAVAPEYPEGVTFTSAAAENAADAAVASGDLDPDSLEAGGGSGADGAYKSSDF